MLETEGLEFEPDFRLDVVPGLWDHKSKNMLQTAYLELGGKGEAVSLERLKFDFKIDRYLFVYDGASHFNRYRLSTLKTDIYSTFNFPWVLAYRKLCRQCEKECLKSGVQERTWFGPPLAAKCFGPSSDPGDLYGNGSSGWKLNAFNDMQYDLISRLSGFILIRIPMYETLFTGGSLKKIDQLLLQPQETHQKALANWIRRIIAQ
ncbi:DUF7255 family protein [Pararhodonellum marinum]|uniref:DUF7255 family protein n=1 Tax=Pararhodonellum marinum TaxID=2755358 RepID=UPI001E490A58|nr:hypothetical protein [Pararhodonellum marinum]